MLPTHVGVITPKWFCALRLQTVVMIVVDVTWTFGVEEQDVRAKYVFAQDYSVWSWDFPGSALPSPQ